MCMSENDASTTGESTASREQPRVNVCRDAGDLCARFLALKRNTSSQVRFLCGLLWDAHRRKLARVHMVCATLACAARPVPCRVEVEGFVVRGERAGGKLTMASLPCAPSDVGNRMSVTVICTRMHFRKQDG
jgi:hypothetical protein